jgi:hypothetical protein
LFSASSRFLRAMSRMATTVTSSPWKTYFLPARLGLEDRFALRDEIGEIAADKLGGRTAEDGEQSVVDLQDAAVPDDGDPLEGRLEEVPEALLAAPNLPLGDLSLGDLLLRALVETNVLDHRGDLVGDRRQEPHVAHRVVVVGIAAADQPDADGLGLEGERDGEAHPGARPRRLRDERRRNVAPARRQEGGELVDRGLGLSRRQGLLIESLPRAVGEQVEGRLADEESGEDLVGDNPGQNSAIEGRGNPFGDDPDDLLLGVADAENVPVDEELKACAQERCGDGEEDGGDEDGHRKLRASRRSAPAQKEERRDEGDERNRRKAVGAHQAVGAKFERPQVVLVDGVDIAHRQQGESRRREDRHPGEEVAHIDVEAQQDARVDAEERDVRPQAEQHAEEHDPVGHLDRRVAGQGEP